VVSTRPGVAEPENPVDVLNPGAAGRFVLVGDHAGHQIPPRLGDLGVGSADLARHIACDLGVASLGRALSAQLDATFISQRFSRLVIDCNRDPDHPESIVAVSDGTPIPGNLAVGVEERARRRRDVFEPYHATIASTLDARPAAPLVALHSFTPTLQGLARPWRLGVLHRGDSALSRQVLERLRSQLGHDAIGDNQPYRMDITDYTVPHHCDARRLDYLELEVRQDELATADACEAVATLIVNALR
jgi:predicted N-formylglutamate amidohydrolase